MNYIILIAILVVFLLIIIIKFGNLSFWKIAQKDPEFVYKQLKNNDAWIIDDGSVVVDKKQYDGPFFLPIPSMNVILKIYGKIGKYEESQNKIKEILSNKQ